MITQVILTLGDGSFIEGFGQTTIQIRTIGKPQNNYSLQWNLPHYPALINTYQKWQDIYYAVMNTRAGFKSQVTNVSIFGCNQEIESLRIYLNDWLAPVKQRLEPILEINESTEIQLVIQTQNINNEATKNLLEKLPWHWWDLDLFHTKGFTDVAVSFTELDPISDISEQRLARPKRVKILCILGDSENIDVEADRRLLRQIPGAYCVFLRQPRRSDLELILNERWDILFFSGHSKTDVDVNTGLLYLNPEEVLNIQEIRNAIQAAIDKGLKLAIFNSCDGLGLARQLADLDIAQIIVWREPVPDKIAQEFLKYFLDFFTTGFSLYSSVQQARIKVKEYIQNPEINEQFPKVSWLPVIHHNLAKAEMNWHKLRGYTGSESNVKDNQGKNNPRQILLNLVQKSWIEGVLEKSLHLEHMIELGLEKNFNAVTVTNAESFNQENQVLPEGTRAIDIFGELENKRTMLILGEPGAGKTTALLEIARELVNDAREDNTLPIPVVLNLSSWGADRKQKSLDKWLVEELNRFYQFPRFICESLIKNQQLLLLLDGLDEIGALDNEVNQDWQREACIRAINQFLRSHEKTEMVVCSRLNEYNLISERLDCQCAVLYKPITSNQVNRYLDDNQDTLPGVKVLFPEDLTIQSLAENPLTLNIMTFAYQEKSREDLAGINSFSEREKNLLDTYVEEKFKREQSGDSYSDKNAKHWLTWLAQRMLQQPKQSKQIFLIEQIQQNWLPRGIDTLIYHIGILFIWGVIAGLIGVLHFGTQVTDDLGEQISFAFPSIVAGITSSLIHLVLSNFFLQVMPRSLNRNIPHVISGILSGLIYVIIAAPWVYAIAQGSFDEKWREIVSPLVVDGVVLAVLLSRFRIEIGIIDAVKTSWKQARIYATIGLVCGSIYILGRWLFTDRYNIGDSAYIVSVIWTELALSTLLPGLVGFLDKGVSVSQTIIPNQGIWRSAKNAFLFFCIFFPVGMFCGLRYDRGGIHETISIGLAVGLTGAMAGGKGSVCAGFVLIQHFMLRVILWLRGFAPWNYARFLDYAAERGFLRKVGGGYIFIHRMLMEHFAQM
ncbi:NACHT domain-containing protein [Coleofasciculus sp. E1-EBD-02]|uniref:NACHT domain-containing protein n=1 Tax=Coleofasciculus sp. E1-EBD-02 TaxID=3068481 RepID=UPI0032FD500F